MAVDDFLTRETDALVLPPKTFYPLRIPVLHYQLRHFISSPEPNLLYYASGQDVYCLNVESKKRAHVASLPFEARCTAAGHGWICVGGPEDGNFAVIKLDAPGNVHSTEVDALLPLDLGSRSRTRPPFGASKPTPRFEKIGEEIVNSISIHKYPAEGDLPEDVVAVLTNNDKTVRVYSLTRSVEITMLELPMPMNHATISPNGQLLVAVGDYQQAYFYQRNKRSKSDMGKSQSDQLSSAPTGWSTISVVQLHCPPSPSTQVPNVTGYFTTVWSSSGSMCAVGSECGYITVFDTEMLLSSEYGEDAIVAIVPSSRPDIGNGPGAVRTMIFSPQPWDLLIWSEDQGRVCVADMRTGLKARQILQLDPKEEGLERIEISEFDMDPDPELQQLSREVDFIRRYRRALDSEGNTASFDLATEYIQAAADRRRSQNPLRHPQVVESDNDPHGLTPHERQVLESLRTTSEALRSARDRLVSISSDAERLIVTIPRSINYSPSGYTVNESQIASTANNTNQAFDTPRRANNSGDGSGSPQPPPLGPSITSLRDFLSQRPLAREQRLSRDEPFRRALPLPSTYSTRYGVDAQLRHNREAENRLSQNADVNESSNTTSSPDLTPSSRPDPNTEMRRLRQLARARERVRSMRESQPQPLSSYEFEIMRRSGRRLHWDPDSGVRTTGLAMSEDGRRLYAGTEEGIFEYEINLSGRRSFPSISPR